MKKKELLRLLEVVIRQKERWKCWANEYSKELDAQEERCRKDIADAYARGYDNAKRYYKELRTLNLCAAHRCVAKPSTCVACDAFERGRTYVWRAEDFPIDK